MKCGTCFHENEQDAMFCTNCGHPLPVDRIPGAKGRRRAYLYALLLLPAILAAAAIGYYKFILPAGIAAVVNGEEITLAEVDGMVQGAGAQPTEETRTRMRYAVLSDLITERIGWQEARKAGILVSAREVDDAYDRAQATSGMDREAFGKYLSAQYGSESLFRENLKRRTGIRKFISERLAAGTSDPAVVNNRTNHWLQEAVSRSSVRIALAEQAPASGCGCCYSGPGDGKRKEQNLRLNQARAAALAYWAERHGGEADARLTDFGCHIQVDIIQHRKVAQSLRYQNGAITEM